MDSLLGQMRMPDNWPELLDPVPAWEACARAVWVPGHDWQERTLLSLNLYLMGCQEVCAWPCPILLSSLGPGQLALPAQRALDMVSPWRLSDQELGPLVGASEYFLSVKVSRCCGCSDSGLPR